MTNIRIYDTDYELLDKIAENNDMDIASVVGLLVEYVDEEFLRENNLN
jgi:hypothetical protein